MCGSAAATPSASNSSSSRRRGGGWWCRAIASTRCQLTGHVSGVYVPLNNAIGSVWDQLKSLDKLNDEIGGDLKLMILHDPERWEGLPVVEEIDGFRIVKAG